MALDSTALITVVEYVNLIGIPYPTDASERTRIESAINYASNSINNDLDRTLMSGSTATEIFSGRDYLDKYDIAHYEYVTAQAPIIEIPTPKLY